MGFLLHKIKVHLKGQDHWNSYIAKLGPMMEEQGKEVVKEINRHQESSQGHGRGHQQGNGMHNQVEISSNLLR